MGWSTWTFDANGGTLNSPQTLYYCSALVSYWATAKFANVNSSISSITLPTPPEAGYVFAGFKANDGTYITGSNGNLQHLLNDGDGTAYAQWNNYVTIALDKGEYGTGGTDRLYYKLPGVSGRGGLFLDSTLESQARAVEVPSGGGRFLGYSHNGVMVFDEDGNILPAAYSLIFSADSVFTAVWKGGAIDYFGLGCSTLVAFESDSGENRPRVVTRHYGKAAGADQTGPIWMNPTVKYMVVGNMTLAVTLGKARAKKTGTINGPYLSGGAWSFGIHSGMTRTGYMITCVAVDTRIGRFPVVTVTGVANEGADTINLFAVSIPIAARARPQNLLGGMSGGGHLQTLTLRAICDPVVLVEGTEPCASDVVNGRFELTAETLAPSGESAPAAAGGFAGTGEPVVGSGAEFTRFRLSAEKEIF